MISLIERHKVVIYMELQLSGMTSFCGPLVISDSRRCRRNYMWDFVSPIISLSPFTVIPLIPAGSILIHRLRHIFSIGYCLFFSFEKDHAEK